MKKIFSLFAAVLMAGSMMAVTLVDYNGTSTLPEGITLSGSTAMKNVKINANTNGVDCIQLANSYTSDGVYFNGNGIILHTEGGFKAGDVLSITAFFNNAEDKKSTVELITLGAGNTYTRVWASEQFINARTVEADPTAQTYVLETDMDSIVLGREGKTGTNIWKLSVVRHVPMRVYCKMEHSWWKQDGAAVGIHYWGGKGATNWPGVRMTPVEGVADTWYFDLDTVQNKNVIFTRVNGSGEIADWGAKTLDQVVPTDGKNMFTISSKEVWGDPGCDGEWSVYVKPEPIIDTLYLVNSKGWGAPKVYFYGGTVGQITAWPGDNMTKVAGVQADGFDVYMFSITRGEQAYVIFNNGGSVQSGDLTIAGNEGKYFNFADQTWYESAEAVVCTWYLKAGTAEWNELTPAADRKTFSRRDVYAPAANYYYNGMGADNLKTEIKGSNLTIASDLTEGDLALYTLDPYAKKINVTKVNVDKDTVNYVAGNFTNWAAEMQVLPYAITLPADSALEFKQVRVITTTTTVGEDAPVAVRDTTWYGQANKDAKMTRETIGTGWLLDGEYNVLLTTDAEGEYTFALNEDGTFVVTFPEKTSTAIETVKAGKAVKVVENGQVIIIRDGIRYNAVGAKL